MYRIFDRIKVAVVVGQLYRTNCNLTYDYRYKKNVRIQRTQSFATFPSVSTKRLCKVHLASTSEFPREKLNSLPYRPDHRRRKRSVWPTYKPRKFAIPTETNHLQTTRNLRRLPHTCLTLANKTIPISCYTYKTRTYHLPSSNIPTKPQTVQVLQTRMIKEISLPAKRHRENYHLSTYPPKATKHSQPKRNKRTIMTMIKPVTQ